MRVLKFGVIAPCAVVAILAYATSASALTLPEFTNETTSEAKVQKVTSTFENPGAGLLEGTITSTELSAEMTPENKREGTFTIEFKNSKCKTALGKGPAESLGSSSGTIVEKGKWHVVSSVNLAPPSSYVDILSDSFNLVCLLALGNVNLRIGGDVGGKIAPGSNKKSYLLTVKASGGKQELTEFLNNADETVKDQLVTEVGEKSGPATQNESAAIELTTAEETEIV
jgi:hypothetical protein